LLDFQNLKWWIQYGGAKIKSQVKKKKICQRILCQIYSKI